MSSLMLTTPLIEDSSDDHYASAVTIRDTTSSTVYVECLIRGSLLVSNISSALEVFTRGLNKVKELFPGKEIKCHLVLDQIENLQDNASPTLRKFIRTSKQTLGDLSESLTVSSRQRPILHALVVAFGPHLFGQRSVHVQQLPVGNGNFVDDESGMAPTSLVSIMRKSATLDVLSLEHFGTIPAIELEECVYVMRAANVHQDPPLRELCLKGLTLTSEPNENSEKLLSKLITICKNLDKIVLDDIQVQDSTGSKRQMSFQYLGQAISSLKKLQVLEVSRLDLEQGCVEEMDASTLPEMGGWRQFMASSTLQDSLRSLSMINCNISDIVTVSTLLHHKDGQRFPKLSKLDVSDNELIMVMHILSLRKAYGDEVVITDREVADFAASEEVEEEKKQDEDEDDDDVELLADTFDCTQMY